MFHRVSTLGSLVGSALLLAACGGGGGGNAPPPPPPTFSIGGSASGLVGTVVLQNNGGSNITVSANGSFSVASGLLSGAAYGVTVLTQPELQTCSVANGTGTISGNVTNVTVTCADVAPSSLTLSIQQVKNFRFSWTPVPGSTHFKLMEDPIGTADFAQVGANLDIDVGTTFSHVVPLYKRMNARYRIQACGATRCVDSNTVTVSGNLGAAIGYIKAPTTNAGALLGFAVALSGDGMTLAVGAVGEINAASGGGAVYVFRRVGFSWTQQAHIAASRLSLDFGNSLSLSADGAVLAVGASSDNNGSAALANSGAVYIYSRNVATGDWTERAILNALAADAHDRFGASVSLSGDGRLLAVGVPTEDSDALGVNGNPVSNDAVNSGAVYVYHSNDTGGWLYRSYIKAINTGASDYFGTSVALSGDGSLLAVGAPGEDSASNGSGESQSSSGAAYLYSMVADGVLPIRVKATNAGLTDLFGSSVALSEDGAVLAVGAPGEASNATGINGDEANNSAQQSGAVYLFARSGTAFAWSQHSYVKAFNAEAQDEFGVSLALSADGMTLAVGALNEDGGAVGVNSGDNVFTGASGAAYVFIQANNVWSQQAYVKPWNPGAGDQFGRSLALSAQGTTLAVGALLEDSASTGTVRTIPDSDDDGAPGAGAVYLF
jgi:trimeric autotransporter adhesin